MIKNDFIIINFFKFIIIGFNMNVTNLNKDVFLEIFLRLKFEDLLNIQLVNRKFRSLLTEEFWYNKFNKEFEKLIYLGGLNQQVNLGEQSNLSSFKVDGATVRRLTLDDYKKHCQPYLSLYLEKDLREKLDINSWKTCYYYFK